MGEKIPTITTDRLVLREFEDSDSHFMFINWYSDVECTKYTNMTVANDDSKCKAFINFLRDYYDKGLYMWATCKKESNEPIGMIGFEVSDETEVSFIVGTKFSNRGYATEALSGILHFSTEKLGLKYIWGYHFTENIGAGKVMQKAGMKYARNDIATNKFFGKEMPIAVYEHTSF